MKSNKKDILIIGSMNVDMVVKTKRIPASGETLLGGVFNQFNGGKGANQAYAVSKLTKNASMCAGVGKDSLGRDYIQYFKKCGIDTSLIKEFKQAPTGVAVIMLSEKGENCISVAAGSNFLLTPKHIKKIDFSKFSIVLFQLETPMDTVCEGLKLAKKAGCKTILTPAPAAILSDEMLKNIDYLVPNEHEILLLSKNLKKDAIEAAKALIKKGVENVIITLGKKGCVAIDANSEKYYGIYNVKPVDTVGAGDCFTGSLASGLCLYDFDLDKSIILATASASLSITKMGAQSCQSLVAVKNFIKNNKLVRK